MTINFLLKVLGIHPNTGKAKCRAKIAYCIRSAGMFGIHADIAWSGIEWAILSGRLSADQQAQIDSLSGYQFSKLIIKLAASPDIQHQAHVLEYIKGDIHAPLSADADRIAQAIAKLGGQ